MQKFAFYIDSSACSGCKTCQVACKDKNDLDPLMNWRKVYEISGGKWERTGEAYTSVPFAYYLSVSCMNCEKPRCTEACPTKAFHRNDLGITVIDHEVCMGCRYCEWACPYGVPEFDQASGMMTKCDMCSDYIEKGIRPSCVDSCPMRALDFGLYEEMILKYGSVKRVLPLPDPELTGPGLVIKPHKDAIRAITEGAVVNEREDI